MPVTAQTPNLEKITRAEVGDIAVLMFQRRSGARGLKSNYSLAKVVEIDDETGLIKRAVRSTDKPEPHEFAVEYGNPKCGVVSKHKLVVPVDDVLAALPGDFYDIKLARKAITDFARPDAIKYVAA